MGRRHGHVRGHDLLAGRPAPEFAREPVPAVSKYFRFTRNSSSFEHYPGCSGRSYASFSGACEGVSQDAGLLIWVPDDLDLALTRIAASLRGIPPGLLV